jgi:ABC-type glutathione transport system ATPase component
VIAFWTFFLATYLLATGMNSSTSSTAEVLIFLRDHKTTPVGEATEHVGDTDGQPGLPVVCADPNKVHTREDGLVPLKKNVLNWCDVVYDIRIKGETRRLLDHVSGWVKPGTLTALMGVSGAGKTTLLDVLAQRISAGVVTGDILVNGKSLEPSFQRRAGTQYNCSRIFFSERC